MSDYFFENDNFTMNPELDIDIENLFTNEQIENFENFEDVEIDTPELEYNNYKYIYESQAIDDNMTDPDVTQDTVELDEFIDNQQLEDFMDTDSDTSTEMDFEEYNYEHNRQTFEDLIDMGNVSFMDENIDYDFGRREFEDLVSLGNFIIPHDPELDDSLSGYDTDVSTNEF